MNGDTSPGGARPPGPDIDALCAGVGLNPGFLLKPSEVAKLFRVDSKTVTRWAASNRMASVSTPGGHRRFEARVVVQSMLRSGGNPGEVAQSVAQFVRAIG